MAPTTETRRATATRRAVLAGTGTAGLTAFTGCGALNTATTQSDTGSSTVTLDFWHVFGDELATTIEQMAADFSAQTDGVSINPVSKTGYRETLNQSLQASRAGDPPGIVQLFEIGTRIALDSNAFTPIDSLLPEDKIDREDFLPSVLNYYRTDGTLNSMPFNSSNTIMLYNKRAFKAAGLDPNAPPTTLVELRTAASTIVSNTQLEYGLTWPNHSWMQIEQQFAKQNQLLVNNDNGRAGRPTETNFDSDAGRAVYQWWTDMANADLYLNPGIEAWDEARQAFLTEQAAMLWDSTSNLVSLVAGAKQRGFELGSAYLPTPTGDNSGVVIGGGSLWVPDALTTAEKQAAGAFIAYLTQPDQQLRWHRNSGYFPVRQSVIDRLTDDGWFDEHPNFRTAFDQLQETTDTPATRGAVMGAFPEVRTINEELSVSIITGDMSVSAGLAEMDTQATSAIQDYTDSIDDSA